MTKSKSDYSIQTVRNALKVLEVFSEEEEIGVSDLSRRLSLHKNNVFRLLATLEESGYIEQSARSEQYRLGTSCLELGRAFAQGNTLLRSARPILIELCAELHETVHLATLRKSEVIHLASEVPDQLIVTTSRVGLRLPANCTALGKVLLAGLEPGTREQFIAACFSGKGASFTEESRASSQSGIRARTSNTIVDPDKFGEHLASVSVQGFAVDLEEYEVGLRCAAAPVYDERGQVVAAISASGPCFRLSQDHLLGNVTQAVVIAAERLGHHLGH